MSSTQKVTVPCRECRRTRQTGRTRTTATLARTQGFAAGHAHVQNAGALLDSIDQILTLDRLGLTAAGGAYGLSGPEVIAMGDTFQFQATGDALRKNPPLVAVIDGDQTNPIELNNHGEGVYRGSITASAKTPTSSPSTAKHSLAQWTSPISS